MSYPYSIIPQCDYCGQPANQQCGGCKLVHYCSRAHQKLAWREGHKFKCRAFKIVNTDTVGRCMVATRDIKAGEMILKEKPALIGPRMATVPVCLGCNKKVEPTNKDGYKFDYYKCSGCNWPMCGPQCETKDIHRAECELMKKRNYKSAITFDGVEKKESAYCVIAPLRVLLLKETDPLQYENIMNLESHYEDRMDTPLYMTLRANLITFIVQVLGLNFDDETILKVTSIFDTNAYDVRTKNNVRFRGIYVTAAMMAHDCKPNTAHHFLGDDSLFTLIATVPIKKDEMITVTYSHTLWGTIERRSHLKLAKCFDCCCERCKDPSELGTFIGSILCSVCNGPFITSTTSLGAKMISTDPLDSNALWKCEMCNHQLTNNQMVIGNTVLKQELFGLNKTDPRAFEDFIEKYKLTLHPLNCHMVQAKYALSQMYGGVKGFFLNELSDFILARKIELCRELLELADKLEPGWSKFRGGLLLDLQAAVTLQTKRNFEAELITKSSAQESLSESFSMLAEATNILKIQPEMQQLLERRMEEIVKLIEENAPEEDMLDTINGIATSAF